MNESSVDIGSADPAANFIIVRDTLEPFIASPRLKNNTEVVKLLPAVTAQCWESVVAEVTGSVVEEREAGVVSVAVSLVQVDDERGTAVVSADDVAGVDGEDEADVVSAAAEVDGEAVAVVIGMPNVEESRVD